MSSVRQLRNIGQLVQIAFLVGTYYVLYGAPKKVLRGQATNWKDGVAGMVGILFWGAAILTLAGWGSP